MAASPLHMTASAHFVRALADTLETFGFRALQALHICYTDAERVAAEPSARIALDRVLGVFETAAADLGDPQIALRVGHRFRIAKYGKTGALYAYAADLEDVIDLNARYQKLAVDMGEISRATGDDGHAYLCFMPHYEDRDRFHHLSAMLMGAYATAFRWLSWGSGRDIISVDLPYNMPDDGGELARSLLRCDVRFGAETGRILLSSDIMQEPLPLFDAEKRARAIAQLDTIMKASTAQQSFQTALRRAIRGGLEAGGLNATLLAERMDMSDAELRKRMRESGLSYRGELDTVRQTRLVEMVYCGESFAHIADALGYNDQAAFNRAFRRWYGIAPGQWTPPQRP